MSTSGDNDIFQADQGVAPVSLEKMMAKHEEGVQGGLTRWDNNVFSDYYNVDLDRVVRLYARLNNHVIQEVEDEHYEVFFGDDIFVLMS